MASSFRDPFRALRARAFNDDAIGRFLRIPIRLRTRPAAMALHLRPSFAPFAIAMTAGLLVALAAHILLRRVGLNVWGWGAGAEPALVRGALAWWIVAACGLGAGLAAGMLVLSRTNVWLVRAAGLALVILLAAAGSVSAAPGMPSSLGSGLTAAGLGAAMAWIGAYIAVKGHPALEN